MTKLGSPLVALAFALLSSACVDAVIAPPAGTTEGTITVNASQGWQYLSLADSAPVIPTPSAAESGAWDIAFFATNVTLNGGEAGPGGVTGACICQNEGATGDAVLAMTAESELPDFAMVTSVPAGTTFQSDVLTPAIAGWFTGTGASAVADTTTSWLVRLRDSTTFALVRVKGITGASTASPGIITLEYRLQAGAAAPLGPVETFDVLVSAGSAQRIDLLAGVPATAPTAWDLSIQGFTIRLNGGISGAGNAGAAVNASPFASTTTAVTNATAYRTDRYAGVFGERPYFRYNIAGDRRVSPNFNVYLIRRGSITYKLQITSYYGVTGQSRQVTVRWQQLD